MDRTLRGAGEGDLEDTLVKRALPPGLPRVPRDGVLPPIAGDGVLLRDCGELVLVGVLGDGVLLRDCADSVLMRVLGEGVLDLPRVGLAKNGGVLAKRARLAASDLGVIIVGSR